ncbi:hypothetical protein M9H77_27301 [Catharanthus roseus]|uniref:Uncharacterized protein n=1 Tax=Catharanthus roseus TaxID=4058 RepID=A0ACC0AGD4_CATRO|nr:hypothetical protein M9H77_27301 [Catharanthus roseus]
MFLSKSVVKKIRLVPRTSTVRTIHHSDFKGNFVMLQLTPRGQVSPKSSEPKRKKPSLASSHEGFLTAMHSITQHPCFPLPTARKKNFETTFAIIFSIKSSHKQNYELHNYQNPNGSISNEPKHES